MCTMIATRSPKRLTRPKPLTRTPRILCVDDDLDLQTTIELRMRAYEVEVEHAFFGMQGIKQAVSQRPDLIVMDLAMPKGNGDYLLSCIRNNAVTADIPVVVLTGMRNPELRQQILQQGAQAFLQKPISFNELIQEMSHYVDLRKRHAEGGNR